MYFIYKDNYSQLLFFKFILKNTNNFLKKYKYKNI
jgi:hypothetical protein